jgi:hypothetical protein
MPINAADRIAFRFALNRNDAVKNTLALTPALSPQERGNRLAATGEVTVW